MPGGLRFEHLPDIAILTTRNFFADATLGKAHSGILCMTKRGIRFKRRVPCFFVEACFL